MQIYKNTLRILPPVFSLRADGFLPSGQCNVIRDSVAHRVRGNRKHLCDPRFLGKQLLRNRPVNRFKDLICKIRTFTAVLQEQGQRA